MKEARGCTRMWGGVKRPRGGVRSDSLWLSAGRLCPWSQPGGELEAQPVLRVGRPPRKVRFAEHPSEFLGDNQGQGLLPAPSGEGPGLSAQPADSAGSQAGPSGGSGYQRVGSLLSTRPREALGC